MGLVQRIAAKIIGQNARPRAGSQYMRGEASSIFAAWNPILRDSREDVRAAYWRAAARTIDTLHNSGWIAGVVNKGVASIMGTGLRLAAKPDFEAIGWNQKQADEWTRRVEKRWEAWACCALECDAAGKTDIDGMARAALRSYFGVGEWSILIPWIARPESKTGTKLQPIPAHRMTQDSNGVDLFQGIRVNPTGLPTAYRFRLTAPIVETGNVVEISARDARNRPFVRHCFEGDVGQMRGISPFAPVLQVTRQYDQLSNATLTTALQQALMAATIESPSPTRDVLAAFETAEEQGVGGDIDAFMTKRDDWYGKTKFDLGGMARIAHLFPGEVLKFLRSETPNDNYEPFARFLLREIAACGGFTFEDVTGDYTGATYSSIKMSTTTNWPLQMWRRKHIAAPLYQTAYECWLEEDIETGGTPFPGGIEGFHALKGEACRATWRGPAKPIPDELKFALANEKLMSMYATTLEAICAELGYDWEDVLEQWAREKAKREELGLPEPPLGNPNAITADMLNGGGDQPAPKPAKGKKKDNG